MADTLSGQHNLDSYGGDMWTDLKKWLHETNDSTWGVDYKFAYRHVIKRMEEIEKEYGVRG